MFSEYQHQYTEWSKPTSTFEHNVLDYGQGVSLSSLKQEKKNIKREERKEMVNDGRESS